MLCGDLGITPCSYAYRRCQPSLSLVSAGDDHRHAAKDIAAPLFRHAAAVFFSKEGLPFLRHVSLKILLI